MADPKATIADVPTLVGEVVSDRYEVKKHLGDGSMGIVFLAEHTHMKKKLALKIMRPEVLNVDTAVERFTREAQAAGHIDHPNVCAASDFGQLPDGRWFLVMEYLEGKTLADVIAEDERLTPERAVHVTRQIASGLQRAHELEVVHRDLKPDNIILIDREGDADFVKITDFGVARVEVVDEQKLTQAGTTMGTPIYMSPEQARAKRVDPRSDLYSLGIMLFEMLTGAVPFYSKSLAVILSMHTKEQPPAMHEKAPDALIPMDLEEIVQKLLSKDPNDRYESAAELIDALDRADLSPHIPGLDAPPIPDAPIEEETSESSSAIDLALATAADEEPSMAEVLSSDDAFEDEHKETVAELVPVGAVELPSQPANSVGELLNRFQTLPAGKRYGIIFAIVAACALPLVVALISLAADSEPPEGEAAEGMAFSEDDVQPADLESERADFLEDHDLEEKYAKAGPDAAVGLLDPLLAENPKNAHLHFMLGKAKADAGNMPGAMPHYVAALDADPRYAADVRISTDALRLAGDKKDEDADAARPVVAALAAGPGAPAVRDALFQQAIEANWSERKRAKEWLTEMGQMDALAAWQKTAVDLRLTGKNCERIKQLVAELGASGEPGALPVLKKTARRPTEGCGFLKKGDCYKCMRDDLKKAIATLEKGGSAPPAE